MFPGLAIFISNENILVKFFWKDNIFAQKLLYSLVPGVCEAERGAFA